MKLRLTLFAAIACLCLSLSAQAADITYYVTGGTLSSGSATGTFSGSFNISPADIIDGGQFTVTTPSGTFSFFSNTSDSAILGFETFTDASSDIFRLAINGPSPGVFALNTFASNGAGGDTAFIPATGSQFNATGGSIGTVAPTPEPSSLILLGTGALGLAGAFRRRFLNA